MQSQKIDGLVYPSKCAKAAPTMMPETDKGNVLKRAALNHALILVN